MLQTVLELATAFPDVVCGVNICLFIHAFYNHSESYGNAIFGGECNFFPQRSLKSKHRQLNVKV